LRLPKALLFEALKDGRINAPDDEMLSRVTAWAVHQAGNVSGDDDKGALIDPEPAVQADPSSENGEGREAGAAEDPRDDEDTPITSAPSAGNYGEHTIDVSVVTRQLRGGVVVLGTVVRSLAVDGSSSVTGRDLKRQLQPLVGAPPGHQRLFLLLRGDSTGGSKPAGRPQASGELFDARPLSAQLPPSLSPVAITLLLRIAPSPAVRTGFLVGRGGALDPATRPRTSVVVTPMVTVPISAEERRKRRLDLAVKNILADLLPPATMFNARYRRLVTEEPRAVADAAQFLVD
jgi:hypothetical protein